ncbi:MAG: hypothetical protein ACPL3P_02275, partial [Anaerolineales bacterium]
MNDQELKPKFSWKKIILKAFILFLIFNMIYIPLIRSTSIEKISLYNLIFPGRLRLPYGDDPSTSYNMTILNLDAMFASHIIDKSAKTSSEFRVILIGDSATWGYLLPN